jgi:hypothetical protein
MDRSYELIFGTVHCVGRNSYPAGCTGSREAAERWIRHCIGGASNTPRVPDSDPLRWCPVHHCHMKRQRIWFGYRSPDGTVTITHPGKESDRDEP